MGLNVALPRGQPNVDPQEISVESQASYVNSN